MERKSADEERPAAGMLRQQSVATRIIRANQLSNLQTVVAIIMAMSVAGLAAGMVIWTRKTKLGGELDAYDEFYSNLESNKQNVEATVGVVIDALLAKQSRAKGRRTGALGNIQARAQVAEKNAAETAAEETAETQTAR